MNLLNVTIQSHLSKRDCYNANMNGLIVATFNPICHSHPVHNGTFLKFSLIVFSL